MIRSDQEPSLAALVNRIQELCRTETIPEFVPRGDKNANGVAERAVQAPDGRAQGPETRIGGPLGQQDSDTSPDYDMAGPPCSDGRD